MVRINAGRERGAVDFSRARINRVMIAEEDPLLGKPPKRRRVFFAHEIRTHPIPDDQNRLPASVRSLGACELDTNRGNDPSEQKYFPNHGSLLRSAPHRISITAERGLHESRIDSMIRLHSFAENEKYFSRSRLALRKHACPRGADSAHVRRHDLEI